MKNITLYYREGASDKVYQASLQPQSGGWVVNFAYGRRGSTLATGTKTPRPIGEKEATLLFEKIVREKMAKGYSPGEEGTPYQGTAKEERDTGIRCQLLNPIDEEQAQRLMADPAFRMQEKLDGKRLLLRSAGGALTGINRRGWEVGLPEPIAKEGRQIGAEFLLDGEAIGDVLHVFDLLSFEGTDIRCRPYAERYLLLINLLASEGGPHLRLVRSAYTTDQKRKFLEQLRQENREGVVFKRDDAPSTEGRPASGGSQFKFKFCATATCLVGGGNGKRSVGLKVRDGSREVSVGNVTIPTNQAIPQPGTCVEVRYLYAFEGGSLFQPVYLGPRDDIAAEECVLSQLKFKPQAIAA